MAWVNQYSETLRDLGIEEEKLGFLHDANRGMGMLTDKYIDRMRQQLNSWFSNIIQVSGVWLHACRTGWVLQRIRIIANKQLSLGCIIINHLGLSFGHCPGMH